MRENRILAPSERHGSLMGEPAIGGKSRGSHGRGITRESTTTGVNKYALRVTFWRKSFSGENESHARVTQESRSESHARVT